MPSICCLLLLTLPAVPHVSEEADEAVLHQAGIGSESESLLNFFRRRTPPGPSQDQLDVLVAQLDQGTSTARQAAAAELIGYGPLALASLRRAANDLAHPDRAARAAQSLRQIEGAGGADLVVQAARMLATRKPDAAEAVLLGYRPFADDAIVGEEIDLALQNLALARSRPSPALAAALADGSAARRAAAARALGKLGGASQALVRPLLRDPQPTVRLRAALALAAGHDAAAIPILIDLLGERTEDVRTLAEAFLKDLAGDWAVQAPAGLDSMASRIRREAWAAWWRSVDGPALLDELRNRTLRDDERPRAERLIAQLSDRDDGTREAAAEELSAFGPRVAALLRRVAEGSDRKAAATAETCLRRLEREGPAPLPIASAARLLALRRPAGALRALLEYFPSAESAEAAERVRELLADLGVTDGQADPLLVAALTDPLPARRGAAAYALCRGRALDHLPAVRELLRDPDATVRQQAGLSLAAAGDRQAMPALIRLLSDLPLEQAWEVEELLARLAGEQAPRQALGVDPAEREACREAWAAWWREHGERVDLSPARTSSRPLGYLLIVESFDPVRRSGSVAELDAAGRVRWRITNLQYPQHAELVAGERVLIAEQNLNRVTEREPSGKVVWEQNVPMAFYAQRLRNGNTFVVGRQQIAEFDRQGKEVFRQARTGDTILAGRKFRDGQYAIVTYQGVYVRFDAAGKEVKTFRVPINQNFGTSGGAVLPEDRVLLAVGQLGKVTEYDANGTAVWEANVPTAGVPTRLPNGQTLVVSHSNTRITRLDRKGQVLSEWKELPLRPWSVSLR